METSKTRVNGGFGSASRRYGKSLVSQVFSKKKFRMEFPPSAGNPLERWKKKWKTDLPARKEPPPRPSRRMKNSEFSIPVFLTPDL
jgi:hypothetical protein